MNNDKKELYGCLNKKNIIYNNNYCKGVRDGIRYNVTKNSFSSVVKRAIIEQEALDYDYDIRETQIRVQNLKYLIDIYLNGEKKRALLDTGSQICILDEANKKELNLVERCEYSIVIIDLDQSKTNSCPIIANTIFGLYRGPFNFYLYKDLKKTIGVEVLIGLDLIKKATNQHGIFPLYFESEDQTGLGKEIMKGTIKLENPEILRIIKSFKELKDIKIVAQRHKTSINNVIKAIMSGKSLKAEEEFIYYILYRIAKKEPSIPYNITLRNSQYFQNRNFEKRNYPLYEYYDVNFSEKTKSKLRKTGNVIKEGLEKTGEWGQDFLRTLSRTTKNISQTFKKPGIYKDNIEFKNNEGNWNYEKLINSERLNWLINSLKELDYDVKLLKDEKIDLIIKCPPPIKYREKKELDELKKKNLGKFYRLKPYRQIPWKFIAVCNLKINNRNKIEMAIRVEYSPNYQHAKIAIQHIQEIINVFHRYF